MPSGIKKSLDVIVHMLQQGEFQPVIDRVYALKDVVEAYQYVQTGEKTGNVVVSMIASENES